MRHNLTAHAAHALSIPWFPTQPPGNAPVMHLPCEQLNHGMWYVGLKNAPSHSELEVMWTWWICVLHDVPGPVNRVRSGDHERMGHVV
jgi:hypothetical protein